MAKRFSVMYSVGRARYVINSHNGHKRHPDGSDFFDISIFSNKREFEAAQKRLVKDGYKSE